MENIVSVKIDRRKFLAGATVGSLAVLSLTACDDKKDPKTATKADGTPRPHYAMVYDQNKCIGCGLCKTACNETNHLPPGRSRLLLELQRNPKQPEPDASKPESYARERRYVRVSCQQCQDAPCIRVCPTGAATRDKDTGIVTMNTDRCVGCKYCIAACPYNARYINPETHVADHCNFCLNTRLVNGEDPGCVSACRHGALWFGDENDPDSYVARLLDVKDTVRVRPELGTSPSLHYIPKKTAGV
ncbi:MAG: 4Fe-4S binding protein [Burkholderiales bacterium]|nr:4Fe-4S binding protein [Burkholderiales bacterium]